MSNLGTATNKITNRMLKQLAVCLSYSSVLANKSCMRLCQADSLVPHHGCFIHHHNVLFLCSLVTAGSCSSPPLPGNRSRLQTTDILLSVTVQGKGRGYCRWSSIVRSQPSVPVTNSTDREASLRSTAPGISYATLKEVKSFLNPNIQRTGSYTTINNYYMNIIN